MYIRSSRLYSIFQNSRHNFCHRCFCRYPLRTIFHYHLFFFFPFIQCPTHFRSNPFLSFVFLRNKTINLLFHRHCRLHLHARFLLNKLNRFQIKRISHGHIQQFVFGIHFVRHQVIFFGHALRHQ